MTRSNLNNLTIRNKLLLIYAVCVLIPIILTDTVIMYNVNSNYKGSRYREMQHAMERVEYNLSEFVSTCILFTNNMYMDNILDKFLNKKYSSNIDYYDEYTKMLDNNSLSYNYNYGLLYKIEIFADNASIIGGGKISTLASVKNTNWYQEYKKSGRGTFLYIYYDEAKKFIPGSGTCRTISIMRTLDYYGNKGIEKVLKIDIDYNEMLMDVLNEKIDGKIYVRNKDFILFSNQPNTSGMRIFEEADTLDGIVPTMTKTFNTGNQEWEILVFSKDTPFWNILFQNKGLLFLILLNIFIPTALIYLVGISISHRLSLVADYMGRVEKEQFEVIHTAEGEDEIGMLIRSYNMMVLRIKELIEVVFRGNAEKQALELSKKQAELNAIQSQVNPHFLFNTLETIRMRSLIKGEHETADIIGELAVLFRKSMHWGADYITLDEEMNFIEKYINIQKYRYGDKITFYRYIMEECRQLKIPKLTISNFIENACVHGIETWSHEGVISLTVTKNDRYLFIEISDNGRGFEESRLEEIRRMIAGADIQMLGGAESTGILNTYLRLKMYSDSWVEFEIDSKPENGTDITIKMPLELVQGTIKLTDKTDGEVSSDDQSNDS